MRLSLMGLGPVRIGMTRRQVGRVLANRLTVDNSAGNDCSYLVTEPDIGVSFMMLNAR